MYTLMTIWRCWHVRNEIVHDKRPPPVEASSRFLTSYISSLLALQADPLGDHVKGKMVAGHQVRRKPISYAYQAKEQAPRWEAPPAGWAALNVDGSFCGKDGSAGAGMVLRDEHGAIIFSSSRELRQCASPLESELAACREGISLASQWSALPIVVQTDCLDVAKLVKEGGVNRSEHLMMVREITRLLQERGEYLVKHVRREQNNVSHYLANYGRINKRTAVWLRSGPDEVPDLCNADLAAA